MKRGVAFLAALLVILSAAVGSAADLEPGNALDLLKERISALGARLKEQRGRWCAGAEGVRVHGGRLEAIRKSIEESKAGRTTRGFEPEAPEEAPVCEEEPKSKTIKDAILEKLGTLSIHGSVAGYYQGRNGPVIAGVNYGQTAGAGFEADLQLSLQPLPDGQLFMRVHTGEGQGADRHLVDNGALFANLNTMADDNPGNDGLSLLEAFYTQTFCNERYLFSIGKTEQLVFIDDNAFANDEYMQFVGKPFVNNPMLDSEDEYGPLFAAQLSPWDDLTLTLLFESTSRQNLEEHLQKSVWDDLFDTPFVAAQLTYSLNMLGLDGNYRLYGWAATYDHPEISGDGTAKGWGIGLSLDQRIHEKIGLFARFAYSNEQVYEAPWFWSVGANLKGLIPSREEDEIGLGIAGLEANSDLGHSGTELHLEAYYRIALSKHWSIAPDLQFVADPRGKSSNGDIVVGMLKALCSF